MRNNKFDKNGREFLMFGAYYELCQEFWIPVQDTEPGYNQYWYELMDKVYDFMERFDDIGLAEHLAQALVMYLQSKKGDKHE